MYKKVLNQIIFPILNQLYPVQKKTMEYNKLLMKSQYWDIKDLHELQLKKLKKLIKHAYTNVPYYHQIFKDRNLKPENITQFSDLKKLPYLTKDNIIENYKQLIPKNISEHRLTPSFTGGTTGKRMKFYIDDYWKSCNIAAAHRGWQWAGYELGDKIIYLWGSLHDLSVQNRLKSNIFNMIQRKQMLNSYNISNITFQQYTKKIQSFKPQFINSYASAAYIMARYLQKEDIRNIQPKAILTSCETLHDFQRTTIENGFNCEVFDYYSARDTSLHATECKEHQGYHLSIENAIVEFTDKNEFVSPGETGEITITDLSNYAMPFIRYKIGDVAIPTDEICPCGRSLPLIKKILGRLTDMIITKDSKYLPGLYFIHIFDTEAIKKYQLIQKTKEKFLLKIVKGKNFNQEILTTIIKKLKEACGEVEIIVEEIEEIPLTSSGKYRFIISEVNED